MGLRMLYKLKAYVQAQIQQADFILRADVQAQKQQTDFIGHQRHQRHQCHQHHPAIGMFGTFGMGFLWLTCKDLRRTYKRACVRSIHFSE